MNNVWDAFCHRYDAPLCKASLESLRFTIFGDQYAQSENKDRLDDKKNV
jgi:hypothetical protein